MRDPYAAEHGFGGDGLHARLGALHARAASLDPDGAVRVEHDLDDEGVVEEGHEGTEGGAEGEGVASVGFRKVGGRGGTRRLLHWRPPSIDGARDRVPRRSKKSLDAADGFTV